MIKKFGLHHGGVLLAIVWPLYMISSILGIAACLIGIGWFGGKEYQEWLQRGTVEWPDIITPLVLAGISIYFMKDIL